MKNMLPVIIGLAGCFLPYAAFHIPPQWFYPSLANNYTGWGTFIIILAFGIFSFISFQRKKQIPPWLDGLIGIYLIGLTLFRLYHTFIIFQGNNENNLASVLKVSAYPREGLFLLMISGIWLLIRAISNRKTFFNAR